MTRALQDGEQEAQRVNLGAIIIGLLGQFWVNHMYVLCRYNAGKINSPVLFEGL